jgi:hypothetical protein
MLRQSFARRFALLLAGASIAIILYCGEILRLSAAGAAPKPPEAGVQYDDLQRSARMNSYTLVANSGAARGENI